LPPFAQFSGASLTLGLFVALRLFEHHRTDWGFLRGPWGFPPFIFIGAFAGEMPVLAPTGISRIVNPVPATQFERVMEKCPGVLLSALTLLDLRRFAFSESIVQVSATPKDFRPAPFSIPRL
jgi:hypothetical protein